MKRIILFLLLVSFAFTQTTPESQPITRAMGDLCNSSRTLVSTISIILCLPVLPLLVLGGAVIALYKGDNKTAKLIGKIALGAGVVFGILAVLGIIIYLLVPFIVSSLTEMPMGTDPCSIG